MGPVTHWGHYLKKKLQLRLSMLAWCNRMNHDEYPNAVINA